jgi:hypothetical protein
MEERDIEPIKGTQFTFEKFLWREIAEIRDFQSMNQHYEALKRLLTLIDYLPRDFQITLKYQEKARKIEKELNKISGNAVGVDAYTQMVDRLDDLDYYAETVLRRLLSELCLDLDRKGYMEKPSARPRFKGDKMGVPEW